MKVGKGRSGKIFGAVIEISRRNQRQTEPFLARDSCHPRQTKDFLLCSIKMGKYTNLMSKEDEKLWELFTFYDHLNKKASELILVVKLLFHFNFIPATFELKFLFQKRIVGARGRKTILLMFTFSDSNDEL